MNHADKIILFSFCLSASFIPLLAQDTASTGFVIINGIELIGNKVTKKHIILREVPFHVNDTILKKELKGKLKSARENLLNTSLFNFVTADTIPAGTDRVNVLVSVTERWYTWPIPIFEVQERNFNEWWKTKNLDRANYGFFLNRENFRGRKEDLSFYFQFGYTEKYGISYKVPYLDRKQTSGAGISFSYSRNREIAYKTDNNHVVYFKNPEKHVRQEFTGKLNYTYRKGIHNRHFVEGKFVKASVDDTLQFYSQDYFLNGKNSIQYLTLSYSYRSDYRNSKQYPLRGFLWEAEVQKSGLGILSGEEVDVTHLFIAIRGYEKLADRFYMAAGVKTKLSAGKIQPYYIQKGLGWRDYVRGYEYYVIDAQNYATFKMGLKYEIIKPKTASLEIPSLNKFTKFHYALYAGIHGDAGYAKDDLYYQANSLANELIYGYGAGIDYVTYYDIVFRFEYSFNKMLEHGFFVHFEAGI